MWAEIVVVFCGPLVLTLTCSSCPFWNFVGLSFLLNFTSWSSTLMGQFDSSKFIYFLGSTWPIEIESTI